MIEVKRFVQKLATQHFAWVLRTARLRRACPILLGIRKASDHQTLLQENFLSAILEPPRSLN